MITRKRLLWALALSLAAFSMNVVSTQEVATVYVPGSRMDEHFARVWVVDAPPFLWIRADATLRGWLEEAGEEPQVTLWRGEQRSIWKARIWDHGDTPAYTDALFRAKYGHVDLVRSLLRPSPTVPVRLEPR